MPHCGEDLTTITLAVADYDVEHLANEIAHTLRQRLVTYSLKWISQASTCDLLGFLG